MAERQTEQLHPLGRGLHRQPAASVMAAVLTSQQQALASLEGNLPALELAAELATTALREGGKLVYVGAGSSGLMALAESLELAGTFGIPRVQTPMLFAGGAAALVELLGSVEDNTADAQDDVARAGVDELDVVFCLSASGSTPYTLAVAQAARAVGAKVIGIANTVDAELFKHSDLVIYLATGPEVVAGSTRLGAATAQKVALNMISVLVGVQLGAVHDGQMVNLVADNIKLVDRAARIVSRIAGCEDGGARDALRATNGAVKPAILVARGYSADAAAKALVASGGSLAPYLD